MLLSDVELGEIYDSTYHGCYIKVISILTDGILAINYSHSHKNFFVKSIHVSELDYLEKVDYDIDYIFNNITTNDV